MLSLTVKKLDAFKFDGVAESDSTGNLLLRYSNDLMCFLFKKKGREVLPPK